MCSPGKFRQLILTNSFLGISSQQTVFEKDILSSRLLSQIDKESSYVAIRTHSQIRMLELVDLYH